MTLFVELASLRHLTRHKGQLLCAIAGVALGVAAVVGIELAIHSTSRSLALSTRALTGGATHALRGGPEGIDERIYAELTLARGDVTLAPVVERRVRAVAGSSGAERRTQELALLGVDPLAEARLRPWLELPSGAVGNARAQGVFLSAATARELGLAAGDEFRLEIDGWTEPVALAGVLEPKDDVAARALADVCATDVSTAQVLARMQGRLSRIDLAAAADALPELERLAGRLPPGLVLERTSERASELAGMSRAFEQNLRALALLALVVGIFLVYNTATFSVVQRRELFGALRALGTDRSAILRAVLGEALWIGLCGTALGLAAGRAFAELLVPRFERSINDLYAAVEVGGVQPSLRVLVVAAALGIAATLAGALVPALEAALAPPRRAVQRSELEGRARKAVRALAWAGAALLAAAAATLALAPPTLGPGLVALFLVLVAGALAAPAFTALAARAAVPLAGRVLGHLGRVAARGIEQSLSRTGVAVAALAVALSVALSMSTMIASFRVTVARWLDLTLRADVYVSAPHWVGSRQTARLDPELAARARSLDGVDAVGTFRGFELALAGGTLYAAAVEEPQRGRAAYPLLDGDESEVWRALEERETLLVSESLARRRGLARGGQLVLPTERGERSFEIAGVFQDYSTDQGIALMSRRTAEALWSDRSVSGLGLYLAPGVDAAALAGELRASLSDREVAVVRTNTDLRAASLAVFDRTFAVADAIQVLATLVAAVACLASLMALELERARELALLRAEGLAPLGAVRLVLARSLLLGLFAAALALPLGLVVSKLLVDVVQPRAFGWTLAWGAQPRAIAATLALALAASLAAGILPAWRAARASPARALRMD